MSTSLIIRDQDNDSVAFRDDAFELREVALSGAALIGKVDSPESQESAVEALRSVKVIIRDVEKARVTVKQPVLDLCRLIDGTASKFVEELKAEELRINMLIGDYQQEQLRLAREAEIKRQAELRRIEEERLAAEFEARKRAEEEERKRQEEIRKAEHAAAQAKNEAARKKAEEERARLEKERAEAEAKRLAESEANRERAAQAAEAVGGPVLPQTAPGHSAKEVYDYEVTDIWLLVRTNPGVVKVEPIRGEILRLLNEFGVREIKGLKIFPIVKNQISTRAPRVINI